MIPAQNELFSKYFRHRNLIKLDLRSINLVATRNYTSEDTQKLYVAENGIDLYVKS